MLTMSSAAQARMLLAIAKPHFALSSCRRRYEALGQMASGDGDNKLEHFRGEKAEQQSIRNEASDTRGEAGGLLGGRSRGR